MEWSWTANEKKDAPAVLSAAHSAAQRAIPPAMQPENQSEASNWKRHASSTHAGAAILSYSSLAAELAAGYAEHR